MCKRGPSKSNVSKIIIKSPVILCYQLSFSGCIQSFGLAHPQMRIYYPADVVHLLDSKLENRRSDGWRTEEEQ